MDVKRNIWPGGVVQSIDDYTVVRRVFDIPLPGPEDDEAALQEFYDWSRPREETLGDTVPVPEFGSLAF